MRTGLKSLKIASIRGVDLRLHFSLIFLLFYVLLVASLQYPWVIVSSGMALEEITLGPWISGFIFAVGLFFSVAIHEFGHVFVAQAQGVKVRSVTLMMLGGISEMESMPEKPYSEFKLAVIGPIVSIVFGLILWGIRSLSINPEINLFSYWLGNVNIILGVFNLLPAFPLDGGRALRSFLSVRQGNLRATQSSVRVSKVFAWLFGIMGFFSMNLLLLLIAFFVYTAAEAELMVLISKGVLKGLSVNEVMVKMDPIQESTSLSEVAEKMLRVRHRVVPVIQADNSIGLFALDSLKTVSRALWSTTTVKGYVEPTSRLLDVHEAVSQVMVEIASSSYQALPVQENHQLVGMVFFSDISQMIEFKAIESEMTEEKRAA